MSIDQRLMPGIVRPLDGTTQAEPASFVSEVMDYLNDSRPRYSFPFMNQDRTFRRLLDYEAHSPYPYAVLIGDAGIGKTMMIDHFLGIIDGKVTEEMLERYAPDLVPSVGLLRPRLGAFEHRDYMILPNLRRPRNPIVIPYRKDEIERDLQVALEFNRAIASLLMKYVPNNYQRMKLRFTPEEFRAYAQAKIADFYVEVYDAIDGATKPNNDTAYVGVRPRKKGPQQTNFPFDASWEFLNDKFDISKYKQLAGLPTDIKGTTRETLQQYLGSNFVTKQFQGQYNFLMRSLLGSEIEGKADTEVEDLVRELFSNFNRTIIRPLRDAVTKSGDISAGRIGTDLRQFPKYTGLIKLSETVHSDLLNRITNMRDSFRRNGASDELRKWMDSIVTYFQEERWQTEKTILSIIEKRLQKELEESQAKKADKKKEEEKVPGRVTEYTGAAFELRHGDHFMPADKIFQVNAFKDLSASGAVNNVVITDFSKESLFGNFTQHNKETPPHMTYTSLGQFFQGGILVFPDYFGRLVQMLHAAERGGGGVLIKGGSVAGMRERFLDYLQTGTIDIVEDGTVFRMEAPRMIVGSDNKNPFVYTDGFFMDYDYGLADRIEMIDVPDTAENSPQVRWGTIKVIYDTAKRFNEAIKRGGGNEVVISPEVVDLILQESLWANDSVASLAYRAFTKRVDEVLRFAVRSRQGVVTIDTLRELNRELFPDLSFVFVDHDYRALTGYRSLPEKQVGFVNGLGVYSVRIGGRYHLAPERTAVASYIVQSRDPLTVGQRRFVLVEEEKRLSDETMNKGHILAADFATNLIHELRRSDVERKSGWQVKTEFYGQYFISGPSASNAAAISMVAVLAGDEVHKNRFFTGTLQPETGEVGAIGAVYFKSLVPTRFHTLLQRDGRSDDMYFVFPLENRRVLKKTAIVDPFGVESRIASIPAQNFWQSYHLATCGPYITQVDIDDIEKRSKGTKERTMERIKERLEELDQ